MQHEKRTVHPGIKWLIAIQLITGVTPLALAWLPNSQWMLPVLWACSALTIAQLTLLSLWVGMTDRKWSVRLVGALSGTAFVTFWLVLAQCISSIGTDHELMQNFLFIEPFLFMFANYATFVALISAGFMVMRSRGMKLTHVSQFMAPPASPRSQYSVLQLLAVMSICSLVLSLVKVAHPDEPLAGVGMVAIVASYILALIIFLINSICAAWATLSPSSPWVRIGITIGVSCLLGIAFAVGSGNHSLSWWMFLVASLIPVVSTTVVVVSLLAVRACGYRIVPTTATPA